MMKFSTTQSDEPIMRLGSIHEAEMQPTDPDMHRMTLLHKQQLPRPILFLSGTTNYTSTRWQTELINEIALHPPKPKPQSISSLSPTPSCTIIDPYNPTWDASWSETSNNVPFRTQVEWELEAQIRADVLVVGFCGEEVRSGVKGPGGTSLGELGMVVGRREGGRREGKRKEVLVCVEEGFWNEGYVEILCGKFGVRCFKRMGDLIGVLREVIEGFEGEGSNLG
ncbi:nucleoside 2-deoxyribosyltransferase domain-containing protein [Rutstroemia sp. NJR-2017a WRK4]|nr:nucleoside 2-deoxyribosyltransferase domain-containing protein [Rutstroemia sp. NJR-2017a WRK4]